MKEVVLFIEGGGDSKRSRQPLRLGFRAFVGSFPSGVNNSRRPRIVLCGTRRNAFDQFRLNSGSPESCCLLLVDSEGPVQSLPAEHLRITDKWQFESIDPEMVHLMVQAMEAWFIADKAALQEYYGNEFNVNALPKRQEVEEIPKEDLKPSLREATKSTTKGKYHEIKHASEILERLNRDTIRKAAPHCNRLFRKLEEIYNAESES